MKTMSMSKGAVLISCDEGKGFFDRMKSTVGMESHLVSAFSGTDFRYTTITHQTLHVETPHLSIGFNVQPDAFLDMIRSTKDYQGFMDRLTLVCVQSLPKPKNIEEYEAMGKPVDEQVRNYNLTDLMTNLENRHKELRTYKLTKEAKRKALEERLIFDNLMEGYRTEGVRQKAVSKLYRAASILCSLRESVQLFENQIQEAQYLVTEEDVVRAAYLIHQSNHSHMEYLTKEDIVETPVVVIGPDEVQGDFIVDNAKYVAKIFNLEESGQLVEKINLVRRTEDYEVIALVTRLKGALQNSNIRFEPFPEEQEF